MEKVDSLAELITELINRSEFEPLKNLLNTPGKAQELARAIIDGRKRSEFIQIVPSEDYGNFRQLVRDKGIKGATITLRRGQFGGIFLKELAQGFNVTIPEAAELEAVEKEQESAGQREQEKERNFYPLVKKWAEDNGFNNCEIVGGALPRYRWENPDLISLDYAIHAHQKSLELLCYSFEVKLNIDPFAVWQAAHYRRFSNEVYLAVVKTAREIEERYDGRVINLAVEFGIGVLCFEEREFRLMHRPRINKPDPEEIELVIQAYEGRETTKKMLEEMRKGFSDLFTIKIG